MPRAPFLNSSSSSNICNHDNPCAKVNTVPEESTEGNAKTYVKGIGKGSINHKSDWQTVRTYTKEERWATGKGWCAGGKGGTGFKPKKRSQFVTKEEYDKIQAAEDSHDDWDCPKCGYHNAKAFPVCQGCSGMVMKIPPRTKPSTAPLSPSRKASAKFDWKHFLSQCEDPDVVEYLEQQPDGPFDFQDQCERLPGEALWLETNWKTEKELQQKKEDLFKSKQACTGRVPDELTISIVKCMKSIKFNRNNIDEAISKMKGHVAQAIRKRNASLKAAENVDFIASHEWHGFFHGYTFDVLEAGMGYYKSDLPDKIDVETDEGYFHEDDLGKIIEEAKCDRATASQALEKYGSWFVAIMKLLEEKEGIVQSFPEVALRHWRQ